MTAEEMNALSNRAHAAARARGLDSGRLLVADDALGLDSGAWRGELLALVREAWGPEHSVLVRLDEDCASVSVGNAHGWIHEFDCVSLAVPLVQALEAAPQPTKVKP